MIFLTVTYRKLTLPILPNVKSIMEKVMENFPHRTLITLHRDESYNSIPTLQATRSTNKRRVA